MGTLYTRTGDNGTTGTPSGKRLRKQDLLFGAVGDIDELNSYIGESLFYIHNDTVRGELRRIQNDLFTIGADMVSMGGTEPVKEKFSDGITERLEVAIDDLGKRLPEQRKFVIPGGCEGAVHLHVARAMARRAERSVFAAAEHYGISERVTSYTNRLSSYLFAAALYLNHTEGIDEEHPTY